VGQIIYIGKESNKLEEMEEGTIHSAQSVYPNIPTRAAMNGGRTYYQH
jgi:hypothetical protein